MRFEYFKITERIAWSHDHAIRLGKPVKCVYLTEEEMKEFDDLVNQVSSPKMWDGILIKPEETPLSDTQKLCGHECVTNGVCVHCHQKVGSHIVRGIQQGVCCGH